MSPSRATSAFGAVVLAAGRSSRMGAAKPLLPVGELTALERVVSTLRTAGVEAIVVVVGHQAQRLALPLADSKVIVALNPEYDRGMFSSVQVGVAALPPGLDAFFIWPVDHPLVRAVVIQALCSRWSQESRTFRGDTESSGIIIQPTCCGQRGHPPLLAASLRRALLTADPQVTLRDVFGAMRTAAVPAVEVEVEDLTILMDMDTAADHRLLDRLARTLDGRDRSDRRPPSEEDCLLILSALRSPENVVRHCQAVAQVGHAIAAALAPRLPHIDADMVRAACLLHDMVRTQPRHAALAERLLVNLGLARLGALVGQHMVLEPDRSREPGLSDAELVYLADKLVFEDEIVGLGGREARALEKIQSWPEAPPAAIARMSERMQSARRIAAKVETVLSLPLTRVLEDMATAWQATSRGVPEEPTP